MKIDDIKNILKKIDKCLDRRSFILKEIKKIREDEEIIHGNREKIETMLAEISDMEPLVENLFDNLVDNITHIENLPSLSPHNCQFGILDFDINLYPEYKYMYTLLCNQTNPLYVASSVTGDDKNIFALSKFVQDNYLSFLKIFAKDDQICVIFGCYSCKKNACFNTQKIKVENLEYLSNLFVSIL